MDVARFGQEEARRLLIEHEGRRSMNLLPTSEIEERSITSKIYPIFLRVEKWLE